MSYFAWSKNEGHSYSILIEKKTLRLRWIPEQEKLETLVYAQRGKLENQGRPLKQEQGSAHITDWLKLVTPHSSAQVHAVQMTDFCSVLIFVSRELLIQTLFLKLQFIQTYHNLIMKI